MATQAQAEAVFATLQAQLGNHPNFVGIEIAALERGGVYTNEVCVRVLVNSPAVNHQSLNIPTQLNGVPIQVRFSDLELH